MNRKTIVRPAVFVAAIWALLLMGPVPGTVAESPDPQALVVDAFHYMRGDASVSTVEMIIQRPDWQRRVTIKAWTRGEKESLFVITAPAKDHGNGTLKKGKSMWMYNPKLNRVIKLPPSMMAQAWQGSDFSNNDLAKSDTLISDYDHRIEKMTVLNGHKVFHVKSMPKPDAPVVWGMLTLKIREDLIILEQTFYDEDLLPVKTMTTTEIQMMSGKLFPRRWQMQKADSPDAYTRLEYRELAFKKGLPNKFFTVSNLKSAKR